MTGVVKYLKTNFPHIVGTLISSKMEV